MTDQNSRTSYYGLDPYGLMDATSDGLLGFLGATFDAAAKLERNPLIGTTMKVTGLGLMTGVAALFEIKNLSEAAGKTGVDPEALQVEAAGSLGRIAGGLFFGTVGTGSLNPLGVIAVGAFGAYATGQVAEFGMRTYLDWDKNLDYPDHGWQLSPYAQRYEPNPYQKLDPELGSVRYSGYTGINTGFDTPSEINPGDRPSSLPVEPEIAPTASAVDLGNLPVSDPYFFAPNPVVTPTNPVPTLEQVVPTPIEPISPPPSQPSAPPSPSVDPQGGIDGHYWGPGRGNGFGGGFGNGGNGEYYDGSGSGYGGGGSGGGRGGSGGGRGGSGGGRGSAGGGGWYDAFSGYDWASPQTLDYYSGGGQRDNQDSHYNDYGGSSGGGSGSGRGSGGGGSGNGGPASGGGTTGGHSGGNSGGWDGFEGVPVLLDLQGDGLDVAELSASSKFIDLNGNGYQQRTAWAADGTGVLVLDADGDGKISRSNEFIFTEWDSSASGDLEAIKNVFDSNGNGKLDSGDARWSQFKVEVDGQLVSLDSLGIVSIDLTPTGSGQTFTDGSAITGTAKFTRADGTTGTVGDTVLAVDGKDYVIRQASTTNDDGSITNTILGYNKDGSLAFRNLVTTNTDENTVQTQFDDDGNGTIDRSQTNAMSVDDLGGRTKTISNFNADGSLRDYTVTVTSADMSTITTTIDQDGDGWDDQRQTFVKDADGSSTTTTERLSSDGTILSRLVIDAAADGLSKTSIIDINGDGRSDLLISETTVIAADGGRSRTVTQQAENGTRLSETTTTTSANNKTKTISEDTDGDGSIDSRSVTETAVSASGDIIAQSSIFNGNGTLRGKTTIITSADGLSTSVSSDVTGDGVADRIASDTKIIAGDGTQTQTLRTISADGTLLSKSVTTTSGDRKTMTIASDTNGDGANDIVSNTAVGVNGTTTTVRVLNADGSLVRQSVAVASADGLTRTTREDIDGDGTDDRTISTVLVAIGGDTEETDTITSGSGALLGKTVTITSADSLSQVVQVDLDGDGTFDQTTIDVISLDAGGARTETVTVLSANGTLNGQVTTIVGEDRKTTFVETDTNGDYISDNVQIRSVSPDGQIFIESADLYLGNVIAMRSHNISADGLTVTSMMDLNGDFLMDRVATDQTVIGDDGSRTRTVSVAAENGKLLSGTTTVTSGSGLSVITSDDLNGDDTVDVGHTQNVTLNVDGSVTKTVSSSAGTTLIGSSVTTVNATGFASQIEVDADGDGTIDRHSVTIKTLNANGSSQTTELVKAADNSLLSSITTHLSADGKSGSKTIDLDGNGIVDVSETVSTNAAGVSTNAVETYNANGSLNSRSVVSSAASGLSRTSSSDADGDGVFDHVVTDITTIDSDGGQTRTVSKFGAGSTLTSRIITRVSADGLTKTETWADGSGATVRSLSDVTVRDVDGGLTETLSYFKADGSLESEQITTTPFHGLMTTVSLDIDGDGRADQFSILMKNSESIEQVLADLPTNGEFNDYRIKRIKSSADGLSRIVEFHSDASGDDTTDKKVSSVAVLNADGSKTTTIQESVSSADEFVLTSTTIVDLSGDGLSVSTQWDTTGSGSFDKSQTDITVLNADGSRERTISTYNGASLASRYEITKSANGLSVTEKWDRSGSDSYSQTATDVTTINVNGTTTRTITNTKSDGTLISKSVTTTDISGRVLSTSEERPDFINQSRTAKREVLADGAVRETFTQSNSAGSVVDKTTALTSADKLTVTVERDVNGDGIVDQRQQTVRTDAGILTSVTTDLRSDGTVRDSFTSTVSADGRKTTIDWDLDGDGSIDRRRVIDDSRYADGSRTTMSADTDLRTGALSSTAITQFSADGRTVSTSQDVDGDGTVDQVETTTTDATGAEISIVTTNATACDVKYLNQGGVYWKQAVAVASETSTSLDGRTSTLKYDYDGDGIFETTMQTVVRIDGSVVTNIVETVAGGAITAVGTISTSADGLITKLSKDTDNNGTFDHTETAVRHGDGSVTLTKSDFDANGNLTKMVADKINSLGSLTGGITFDGQGRRTVQTDLGVDGSSVTTTYDPASGQILTITRFNKAGLPTSASLYDPLNTDGWSRVEQQFDASGKKVAATEYGDDGSWGELTFDITTGAQQRVRYFNAGGQLTSVVDFDVTSSAGWSRVTRTYDTAGRVTAELYVNDNGTKTQINYDTAGRKTGQTDVAVDGTFVATTYDAASGQIVAATRWTSAGVQTGATIYDLLGTQLWTRVEQQFDASGKKTAETQYNDNGTKAEITFHVTSGAQQRVRYFNAGGQLSSVVEFDVTNSAGWSQLTRTYNTAGGVTAELYVNDNGTKTQINYDTAARKTAQIETATDGSTVTSTFDPASGQLLSISRHTGAGVQTSAVIYDPVGVQPWARVEQQFDSAGNKTIENQYNDNETRTEITFYGANGAQQRIRYFNAGGELTGLVDFDVTNAAAWSQISKNYDAGGQVAAQLTINDDGTKLQYNYDLANTQAWSTYAQHYDSAGRLYYVDQVNDNGTHNTVNYDVANTQTWSRYERSTDAAGTVLSEVKFGDDGLRTTFLYDVSNAQAWSRQEQTYDASDRLLSVNQLNDNGTRNTTNYDVSNAYIWSREERYLDGASNILQQTTFNDDGSRNAYHYDLPNMQVWSSIEQRYNGAGVLEWQLNRWDDGSTEKTTYNVSNNQPWLKQVETKNAAGAITTLFDYFTDNSSHRRYWDLAGVQAWSQLEQYVDAAGKVTAQYLVRDNGVVEEYRASGLTARQMATFDPNYYLSQYPDIAASWNAPPIEHFIQYGWKQGRNPNASFDTNFYLNTYPDVRNSGVDPFAEWRTQGYAQGRAPNATYQVFDARRASDIAGISEPAFADLQLARIAEMRDFLGRAIATFHESSSDNAGVQNTLQQRKKKLIDILNSDNRTLLARYPEYVSNRFGVTWVRPIVLDLDRDQHIDLRMFSPAEFEAGDGPRFDWDDDGIVDGSTWAGASDGWLAIDLAADGGVGPDGIIDQARELAFTMWKTPGELAEEQQSISDLDALRLVFDTNHNNVLDAGDQRWSEFRIWQDGNQNGVADAGELRTLEEADIRLIGLVPSSDGARDFADGSAITGTSSYLKGDGTSALVGDVTLTYQHAPVPAQSAFQ